MPANIGPSHHVLHELLTRRLRVHNAKALAYAGLCAAGALLAWGALYGLTHWAILLLGAIIKGPDTVPPKGLPIGFSLIALTLLFSAWVDRRVTTNALPPDEKTPREIAMDFLLAVPRMTLEIAGNLSARSTLSSSEIDDATYFVEMLVRVQRIPLQEAPIELPDADSRDRILHALMMLGLVEVQHVGDAFWLRIPPSARLSLGFPRLE